MGQDMPILLSTPGFDLAIAGGLILLSALLEALRRALESVARLPNQKNGSDSTGGSAAWVEEHRDAIGRALGFLRNIPQIVAAALAGIVMVSLNGAAGLAWAVLLVAVLVAFAGLLSRPLFRLSQAFWGAIGLRPARVESGLSAHEELRGAVDAMHREGSVVKADRDRLGGVLDLGELEVSDIMKHRMAMRAINADDAPEIVVRTVLESPFTRMPVWRGATDNIIGVVHAKDVLRALAEPDADPSRIDIVKIAQKPWFVPDSTNLKDQLNAFLRRKSHFAVVVDEYGEVQGIVTLEDIIEEIVGDIADEHDLEIQGVRQEADGSIVVDGGVPIRDLNRALDWNLPDEEATTIAGLVIHESRSIPEERQAFTFHNMRFIVMKRVKNRITQLRIRPVDTTSPTPGE